MSNFTNNDLLGGDVLGGDIIGGDIIGGDIIGRDLIIFFDFNILFCLMIITLIIGCVRFRRPPQKKGKFINN